MKKNTLENLIDIKLLDIANFQNQAVISESNNNPIGTNSNVVESKPITDDLDKRIELHLGYISNNYRAFPVAANDRSVKRLFKKPLIKILKNYTAGQETYNDNVRSFGYYLNAKLNDTRAYQLVQDARLEDQINSVKSLISSLDQKLEELKKQNNNVQDSINTQNDNLEKKDKEIKKQSKLFLHLKSKTEEIDNEINSMKSENKKYKTNFTKLEETDYDINMQLLENISRINSLYEMRALDKDKNAKSNISTGVGFSQFGEDLWLYNNHSFPQKGIFIDVGTADGITYSNTYLFEKLGWKGLCFEPDPRNFKKAKEYRDNVNQYAIGSYDGEATFHMSNISPDLSSLNVPRGSDKSLTVEVHKLDTILKKEGINHIDILSIDTEGTEADVWAGLDYMRYRPRFVIAEYLNDGVVNASLKKLFEDSNYKLVHQTKSNYIFERVG